MQGIMEFIRRTEGVAESGEDDLADAAETYRRIRAPHARIIWNRVLPAGPGSRHIRIASAPPNFEVYAQIDAPGHASFSAETRLPDGLDGQAFRVDSYETPSEDLGSVLDEGRGVWIKHIGAIRRRPDLSREAFIEYYESQHAPLAARTLPMIARYRRNFISAPVDSQHSSKDSLALKFDVITEFWFRSQTDRSAMRDAFNDADLARMFVKDEKRLFDRGHIHGMDVTESRLGP